MFSGIIDRLGTVTTLRPEGDSLGVDIVTGYTDLALGESVAVNGVCLTAAALGHDTASFFISPESIARSNLGDLAVGTRVNLERALTLDTRLSGHMVQGHVDARATLAAAEPSNGAHKLEFEIGPDIARYCVEKGSITLNGISLTINGIAPTEDGRSRVAITIIPHTWEHTNLHALSVGDAVNVEVDVIAKYVERLCQPYLKP